MNTTIDNVCSGLRNFAQSLKDEASNELKNILPLVATTPATVTAYPQQSNRQVSNPERPWMLAGGAALAIGVVGILSSGGTWSYLLSVAGVGSLLYGQSKKKHQVNNNSTANSTNTTTELKSYEIAEKVIEISKSVEAKWRAKVEECKSTVQRAIQSSSAAEDDKNTLLSQTYTTERVSLNFDSVVGRIESSAATSYPGILTEYGLYIGNCIDKAANEQIAIYNKVSQKL